MKLRALLLGLLALSGLAWAEGGCPYGMTPRNYGATVGCVPGGNDRPLQQQQEASRPTGCWETTWGAIAPSPVGGVVGTALGASSKKEAERLALADCKAKGGAACAVNLAYDNQCAVMIIGVKYFNSYSNATIEEATDRGLKECRKDDTDCRVYYSACTEPIFHRY